MSPRPETIVRKRQATASRNNQGRTYSAESADGRDASSAGTQRGARSAASPRSHASQSGDRVSPRCAVNGKMKRGKAGQSGIDSRDLFALFRFPGSRPPRAPTRVTAARLSAGGSKHFRCISPANACDKPLRRGLFS
ncbi:hypothetical protein CB1_001616032 [Camelus ferus]|nr:hypothetical protein CB1_001616032 [Camelus ferus]